MKKPEVSIVIVNYNVKDLLRTCLSTLFAFHQDAGLFEVIVVDNQSVDGSIAMIKNEFPQVILLENSDNAGFPKANNQGFQLAKGKYIFMLNPDTEFLDNAVEKLFQEMEQHEDYMLLAPKLLNTDRSRQASVWRNPSLISLFLETHYLSRFLKKKNYLDQNFKHSFEAESVSGAAIFFRTKILKELGGLDEKLFWIEDVDFCYRARQKNMKCIYEPAIELVHHVGQSAKKNYTVSILNQVVNKIKFAKKHYSKFNFVLTTLLSAYHVLIKILVFGLLSPTNVIYFRKWKAYLYTFPRVFNPPKGIK